MPSIEEIVQLDALFYKEIKDQLYTGNSEYSVAFFPLFPLIWKLSGAEGRIIIFINYLIFISGFFLLAKAFSLKKTYQFLLLSIPSFLFMWLPYSEAVFFFLGTLLLIGLKHNNSYLISSAVFFCCLSRPIFSVFIPALVLTYFLFSNDWKQGLKKATLYALSAIVAILTVALIQYINTGKWFGFIISQKHWDHYLRLPSFPFTSWAGTYITMLDGLAFFAGLFAAYYCIKWIKERIVNNETINNKAFVFSALYMAGIAFSILLFQGGNMHSMNRYIFATPFFILFLSEIVNGCTIKLRHFYLLFIGLSVFWLMFGSYLHILSILKFMGISFYAAAFIWVLSREKPKFYVLSFAFYLINCCISVYFYLRFLSGGWVG